MMGWFATIKAVIAIAREAYRFLKEVDDQGAARLGPQAAQKDRRRLQRLAVWLHEGEDKGWRRLFKADNKVDEYMRDVLQSDLLRVYLDSTTSTLDHEKARAAIMAGAEGLTEPRVYPVH